MQSALISAELPRLSISTSNENASHRRYIGSSPHFITVVLFVEHRDPAEPNIEDLGPITDVLCLVARRYGERNIARYLLNKSLVGIGDLMNTAEILGLISGSVESDLTSTVTSISKHPWT